jgi:hypothetical protein
MATKYSPAVMAAISGEETMIQQSPSSMRSEGSIQEPLATVTPTIQLKKRVYEFTEGNIHDKDFLGLRGDISDVLLILFSDHFIFCWIGANLCELSRY